jgi:hypothetical protein
MRVHLLHPSKETGTTPATTSTRNDGYVYLKSAEGVAGLR